MYQDTSLEREGAPTRQEAEHDAFLDAQERRLGLVFSGEASAPDSTPFDPSKNVAAALEALSDDPWAADLRNNPDRNDEVELF